jgi:hypothetical protein
MPIRSGRTTYSAACRRMMRTPVVHRHRPVRARCTSLCSITALVDRKEQLREWESSRKAEIWIDQWAHWSRSIPGLILFTTLWAIADANWASTVKFGIAFVSGMYLTSRLVVWLRLWGAFIERRLTEIESRVLNRSPDYYTNAEWSFESSPLFERLSRIEKEVEELRQRL